MCGRPASSRSQGQPAAAYDWTVHREVEVAAIEHDFDGYYGWHYPPTFLFVAAALATLPYLAALLVVGCRDPAGLCGDGADHHRRAARPPVGMRVSGRDLERLGGAERLSDRGADRRRPGADGATAGRRRDMPGPAHLQAAIRHPVSVRPRLRRALARHRGGRRDHRGASARPRCWRSERRAGTPFWPGCR